LAITVFIAIEPLPELTVASPENRKIYPVIYGPLSSRRCNLQELRTFKRFREHRRERRRKHRAPVIHRP
jgi:hypothetical protein